MVSVDLPTATNPNTTAPQARQMASLRAAGVEVEVLEVRGLPKLKYLQALRRLHQRVGEVDLVHPHYGFCGWLARCQRRKPVVVSFMGDDLLGTPDARGRVKPLSRLVVQLNRCFARTVDAVVVKSREMAEVVQPVRAHVVANGVDMDLFRPVAARAARAELGWPEGVRYVLFAGNPANPRKGYPLAEATIALTKQRVDAPLKLVALRNVPPERVPLYMNACDAMLMTSLIEGSPNVVKEAMACNLPVVSVPVGDVAELFDGAAGYRLCPRDAHALADALVASLTERQNVEGRLALQRKRLDLESVAQRLLTIYADVLKKE